MAGRGTVGEFLPKYRGPGRSIPVSRITTVKERDPQLWKALLFSCVRTQTDILCAVWHGHFEMTEEVIGGFRAIANCGCFPDVLDAESSAARQIIRLAVAGYSEGAKERLARTR
jgi:N-acetyl-gamma-glutamylphosphate reductase